MEKISEIEGEALAKRKLPGPLHKYKNNFLDKCRPKTPNYVKMSKSLGRIPEKRYTIKSGKNIGPVSYQTEKAFKKFSIERT